VSILLDRDTRVLVQGITGQEGRFHTELMLAYGTRIVGGVTPGKGGTREQGLPIFNSVDEAVAATGAEASILFVPPLYAADGIAEAAAAGIRLVVATTDGMPVHHMLRLLPWLQRTSCRLIGPNCPGIISPGQAKLGFMPNTAFAPGPVGMISKSGSLSYEVAHCLTQAGIGQSTVAGIGGDPVRGTTYTDLLPLFCTDPDTRVLVLLGEIGGVEEERAAAWLQANGCPKPVVAYLVGRHTPEGRRMGHPGAIWRGESGAWQKKVAALTAAGAVVVRSPWEVAEQVAALTQR